ncbi:MAG: methyltransferase family protein [Methanococcaceae archaeon]
MKITGAAPLIAIPTFIYLLLTVIINSFVNTDFRITGNHYPVLMTIAIIMILTGIMGVISAARKLLKSFKQNVLMTDGLFRICRNPMYVSYLVFIIPGICLLFNSWLVLTTVIVNFVLLLVFIPKEYEYLEQTFGDEYKRYLENVWIKFL